MSLEANKQVVRRFYDECMNQGKLSSVESVVASHFVDHSYNLQGIAAVQQFVQESHARFPELQFTIEELIVEGQVVAVRWRGETSPPNPPQPGKKDVRPWSGLMPFAEASISEAPGAVVPHAGICAGPVG